MGLSLEDFAPRPSKQGMPCSIATLLDSLDPKQRAVLEQALADTTVSHVQIEMVLQANGMRVGRGAVGHHRRGHCRCA